MSDGFSLTEDNDRELCLGSTALAAAMQLSYCSVNKLMEYRKRSLHGEEFVYHKANILHNRSFKMDKKDQEDTDFERASARITKTVMNWSIGLTLTTIFIAVAVWDCPHKQAG